MMSRRMTIEKLARTYWAAGKHAEALVELKKLGLEHAFRLMHELVAAKA
jgi:hypothetical protein